MNQTQTAQQFIKELKASSSRDQVDKVARFFRGDDGRARDNKIMGITPGKVFPIAKKFTDLPRNRPARRTGKRSSTST